MEKEQPPIGTRVAVTWVGGRHHCDATITDYQTINGWRCPSGTPITIQWPVVHTDEGHTFVIDPARISPLEGPEPTEATPEAHTFQALLILVRIARDSGLDRANLIDLWYEANDQVFGPEVITP